MDWTADTFGFMIAFVMPGLIRHPEGSALDPGSAAGMTRQQMIWR